MVGACGYKHLHLKKVTGCDQYSNIKSPFLQYTHLFDQIAISFASRSLYSGYFSLQVYCWRFKRYALLFMKEPQASKVCIWDREATGGASTFTESIDAQRFLIGSFPVGQEHHVSRKLLRIRWWPHCRSLKPMEKEVKLVRKEASGRLRGLHFV